MKRPQLMIMSGELAGKRFAVPDGGLRLGRSSSNDVHTPDEELSRNHCLFEPDGESGLRVIDLASANGTYVNSVQLGADAKVLKFGDIIEAGNTVLKVVDEDTPVILSAPPVAESPAPVRTTPVGAAPAAVPPAVGAVDLGLDGGVRGADILADAAAGQGAAKRSPLANILWGVVALAVVSAIVIVLLFPAPQPEPAAPAADPVEAKTPAVTELAYEKVEADGSRIFRYEMTVDADGSLRVVYDDVPGENRHIDKSVRLSDRARARIAEIFAGDGWRQLDDAYTGASASDENELKSWRIRALGGRQFKDVLVENAPEPAAFQQVREALEAFSQNELGIWAIQYSKEKLLELSAASERLGDAKWSDRSAEYGNLSASVAAYREALFYLETVNPKPPAYAALKEKLANATAELDTRYREQRFLADKAINLSDWETARTELRILLELVPARDDDRHAEAKAKLVDVERRLASTKKGGKK